jgi:DNA-binding response OmpR family regulator
MKVALLSHTSPVGQLVIELLSRSGIEALLNVSITAFRQRARRDDFDAVVLQDRGATLAEDLSLIKSCVDQEVPVVVVGEELRNGFSTALACGAADYITLSRAAHDELQVRLRGHVEAVGRHARKEVRIGGCTLDPSRLRFSCGDQEVQVTHREFELAWLLFSRPEQVVTNATIVSRVWGRSADLNKRTLEQHIYKLRAKLARIGCPLRINAVYGRGYQLLTGADSLEPREEREVRVAATWAHHFHAS